MIKRAFNFLASDFFEEIKRMFNLIKKGGRLPDAIWARLRLVRRPGDCCSGVRYSGLGFKKVMVGINKVRGGALSW
jgi:hypothetical protein